MQNGVGNRETLASALGQGRVGQGVTSLGATLLGPGHVRHAGHGPTIFGATPDRAGMAALAGLFNDCGLPAELTPPDWNGHRGVELFLRLQSLLSGPAARHVDATIASRTGTTP